MEKIKYPRPNARINPDQVARQVKFLMPAPDVEFIKAAAEKEGMTMAAYIRHSCLGTANAEAQQRQAILAGGAAVPDRNQMELTGVTTG